MNQSVIIHKALENNVQVIFTENGKDFDTIGIHISDPDYDQLLNALKLATDTQNKRVIVHIHPKPIFK